MVSTDSDSDSDAKESVPAVDSDLDPFQLQLKSVSDIVLKTKADTEIVDVCTDASTSNLSLEVGSYFIEQIKRDRVYKFEMVLEEASPGQLVETTVPLQSTKAGFWRRYELHCIECGDDYECDYVISGVDVSDHQRELQYQQVSRRVFRHNIRNDLNTIRGHADLITSESDDSSTIDESASIISSKATELHRVVDKIQTITKKVEQRERDLRVVDAEAIVQQALSNIQPSYPDVEYRLRVDSENTNIIGNELVGIAIENAIENAAGHNTASEPVVILSLLEDTELESILISIEDNGPGIPLGELRAIKSGNETQLEHTSGVGLWIIKWIVEGLCGTVAFTGSQTFSSGTKLTMRLPMAGAERPL